MNWNDNDHHRLLEIVNHVEDYYDLDDVYSMTVLELIKRTDEMCK